MTFLCAFVRIGAHTFMKMTSDRNQEDTMEAYSGFAQVYDMFMDDTPYEEWCEFTIEQLRENGVQQGLVLDMGCGTGKMTRMLADKGYDMIGVDFSMEMLEIAQEHEAKREQGILYLCQDIREFELYGTVQAIVSNCDCVNYITEEEDLLQVFKLVNNYLDPGGIFFFDFNTKYKYEEMLAENTFAENRDKGSFIWENYYDEESRINQYDLTLFIKQDQLYEKFEETHFQRAYTLEEIKRLLAEAGLEFVAAYDDYTCQEVHEESGRVCVIAREHGKMV